MRNFELLECRRLLATDGSVVFFEYGSADMSAAEIAAYNDFHEQVGPNPGQTTLYELSNGFQLWHAGSAQMPTMTDGGALSFLRQAGDSSRHTVIRGFDGHITDAYDHEACNNGTTLRLGELYEFEFDIEIPDNGSDWWNDVDWMIFFELWGWFDGGDSPINPAFALSIDGSPPTGGSGPHLAIVQRGSDDLIHSDYDTVVRDAIPITGAGSYSIKVQYLPDYELDGTGLSKVWLDGQEIWSWEGQTAYLSECRPYTGSNDWTPTGPVPVLGAYTFDVDPGPVVVEFDNILFTMIQTPPAGPPAPTLPPPIVERVQIDDGTEQRSLVRDLTVTFDSQVNFLVDDPEKIEQAFSVVDTEGNLVAFDATEEIVDGKTVVTLTFEEILGDGNYDLMVDKDRVANATNVAMQADHVESFFRFFGDRNGDRRVDYFDFLFFRSSYNSAQYEAIFDLDGGGVGYFDFLFFRANYLRNLAPPPPE